MKKQTFALEFITPCFCGGAEPTKVAEIRAASIRGQLRWWFRVLGGFRSLANTDISRQEELLFGSASRDTGQAGKLIIRVESANPGQLPNSTIPVDADDLGAFVQNPKGYLLFPLRRNHQKPGSSKRAVIKPSAGHVFKLHVLWRGKESIWDDIQSLFGVWGHLGGLGFRSRRAMGAVAFKVDPPCLKKSLGSFACPNNLHIRAKPTGDADSSITFLGSWLKGWRSHGRTVDHPTAQPPNPPYNAGFDPYAKNDHDRGVACLNHRLTKNCHTYRPALGLPIIQQFKGKGKVNWETSKPKGRFASPVLLRPYRDSNNKWHALIIFVDNLKWPHQEKVYLNGTPCSVSLDLYEAMKSDPILAPFPG